MNFLLKWLRGLETNCEPLVWSLWVQFLLLDLSETWGIPKLDALIIIFPINMDSWLHIIPTDCWFIIHFPCHEWGSMPAPMDWFR